MTSDPYRLPTHIQPVRYEILLEPDLDAGTFVGSAEIEIEVLESTDEIVLNALDLEISGAWLEESSGAGASRRDLDFEFDTPSERLRLLPGSHLDLGTTYLHLTFAGELNDRLHGFYRSTWTDDEGTAHTIATTQMEATHARRAFPCWDEPDRKAVFAITLVIDPHLEAVSNAREIQRTTTDDGRTAIQFADSMVMSTYLVAFIVGELETTSPIDAGGVPIRVVHRPGQGHLASYALEVAAFALDYFGDYYGIPYPGDKLDLVAVPDFAFGAMENMGCVTFREVLLLVNPPEATQPELERVVDVIAHELAHMWFGNLVTMKWWNGIWLNEAFATFMELKCTDAFRPEWDRWVSFGASRTAAFDVDALASTRPIEFEVVSPEDAEGMFDILTYQKGAAVVRMLEQHLGEEPFREGICQYLAAHQYDNTETTDLWDSIEAATGQPAREIMDTWIFQGGFPLVSADLTDTTLSLRQQRFRYLDDADPAARWQVPIEVAWQSASGALHTENLVFRSESLELELGEEPAFVHINHHSAGFLRSAYSPQLLALLGARIDTLTPADRYSAIDDAWSAMLAGRSTAVAFLTLAEQFTGEADLSVWSRLSSGLRGLDRLVDGAPRTVLAGRVDTLVASTRKHLGSGDRTEIEEQRDTLLLALQAQIGANPSARGELEAAWHAHATGTSEASPSLVSAAVSVLASTGTLSIGDLFEYFQKAATPQEEVRFLYAMAETPDLDDLLRLAERCLTDDIRTQNAPYVLGRALAHRDHGASVWTFVEREWNAINERFPSNSLSRMLEGIRSLADADVADEVQRFFDSHPLPQGAQTLAQHLERMRVTVELHRREGPGLAAALGA